MPELVELLKTHRAHSEASVVPSSNKSVLEILYVAKRAFYSSDGATWAPVRSRQRLEAVGLLQVGGRVDCKMLGPKTDEGHKVAAVRFLPGALAALERGSPNNTNGIPVPWCAIHLRAGGLVAAFYPFHEMPAAVVTTIHGSIRAAEGSHFRIATDGTLTVISGKVTYSQGETQRTVEAGSSYNPATGITVPVLQIIRMGSNMDN